MPLRKVIEIDEDKCTGCGLCIPNCPEGALQVIDGKARLVSALFCDGLGACVGHCPEGAMNVVEKEVEAYDEKKVMENIVAQGRNTIIAHLKHLHEHGAERFLKDALEALREKGIEIPEEEWAGPQEEKPCCPGAKLMRSEDTDTDETDAPAGKAPSRLKQWPVQITLLPPTAPFFAGADILLAADCVPFTYGAFHEDFLKGKRLLVGCPKLDDASFYKDKLTRIFAGNDIKSVTAVRMEVPCCSGLVYLAREALKDAGKEDLPFEEVVISIRGEVLD